MTKSVWALGAVVGAAFVALILAKQQAETQERSNTFESNPEMCEINPHQEQSAGSCGKNEGEGAKGTEAGDYGWSDKVEEWQKFIETDECTIPRNHSLTPKDFVNMYWRTRPVIFRAADNSKFRELTSRWSLLEMFGDQSIILSTANTYSHDKHRATLAEYLEMKMAPQPLGVRADQTLYHFGDNIYAVWDSLFDRYARPPIHPETLTLGTISFGVAGSGSGVFFHTHGPAYAEVIHGKKRWLLYPPEEQGFKNISSPALDPTKFSEALSSIIGRNPNPNLSDGTTTQQWVHDVLPKLSGDERPQDCVCGVGEVLYVPQNWFHATLNIGQGVFVSTFT